MGEAAVTRRFFMGGLKGEPSVMPMRPPWALSEAEFASVCTGCGECQASCPQGVLRTDAHGFPIFSPTSNHCTFCGQCVENCAPKALSKAVDPVWSVSVTISGSRCLSEQGTICRSCGELCDEGAISFHPLGLGRWSARVDAEACTGCGACLPVCPSDALGLMSDAMKREAA